MCVYLSKSTFATVKLTPGKLPVIFSSKLMSTNFKLTGKGAILSKSNKMVTITNFVVTVKSGTLGVSPTLSSVDITFASVFDTINVVTTTEIRVVN